MPTLLEFAGGIEAIHRLEDTFYRSVLRDPLLHPLFGTGRPEHVDHLTVFTAESFGGPDMFTRELGFAHLIDVHRGLKITEAQRQRFVELYVAAMDDAMPTDPDFRAAVLEHVEFGSRVAMQTPTRPPRLSCTRCATYHAGPGHVMNPSVGEGPPSFRAIFTSHSSVRSGAPSNIRIDLRAVSCAAA